MVVGSYREQGEGSGFEWAARGESTARERERERVRGRQRGRGWVDRERRVNLKPGGREWRAGPKGSKRRKIQHGSAGSIARKRTGPVIEARALTIDATRADLARKRTRG